MIDDHSTTPKPKRGLLLQRGSRQLQAWRRLCESLSFEETRMNLSVTIDDNLFNQANETARPLNQSLPELLREYLSQLALQANVQREIDELYQLSQPGEGHSNGWRFNRQELYE